MNLELDAEIAELLGCNPRSGIIERNGPMKIWFCTCDDLQHAFLEATQAFPMLEQYSSSGEGLLAMLEFCAANRLRVNITNSSKQGVWGVLLWGEVRRDNSMGGGDTPGEALAKALLGNKERYGDG